MQEQLKHQAFRTLAQLGVPPHMQDVTHVIVLNIIQALLRGAAMALLILILGGRRYVSCLFLWLLHDWSYSTVLLREVANIIVLDVGLHDAILNAKDGEKTLAGVAELIDFGFLLSGYICTATALWIITTAAWLVFWIGYWFVFSILGQTSQWGSWHGWALVCLTVWDNGGVLLQWARRLAPEPLTLARWILKYGTWDWGPFFLRIYNGWLSLSAIPEMKKPPDPSIRYVYKPLDETRNEIRLLVINRRVPFVPISCALLHVSLDQQPPPPFEAVSYVWGDSTRTHVVQVDGAAMPITASVRAILEQKASISKAKTVWIDAVCINQDDTAEKGWQVQKMMLRIYQAARFTTVHLPMPNPREHDAHLVPMFLRHLVLHMALQGPETRDWSIMSMHLRETRQCGGQQPPRWRALLAFFQSSWFERVWVVQELAAARHVRIVYGGRHIHYGTLLAVLKTILQSGRSDIGLAVITLGPDHVAPMPPAFAHMPIMMVYRARFQEHGPIPFHEILRTLMSMKSTVPVDKIYALQGLSDAAGCPDLPVRYDGDPRPAALMNTAYYLMSRPEGLQVLQLAGTGWPHSQPDVPSWVVDWTRSIPSYFAALILAGEHKYTAATRATEELLQQVGCVCGNRFITVHGCAIDAVRVVNPPLREDVSPSEFGVPAHELGAFGKEWLTFICANDHAIERYARRPYPTGQPLSEVVWRSYIGDMGFEGARPAPEELGVGFGDFKMSIVKGILLRNGSDITLTSPDVKAWIAESDRDPRPLEEKMASCSRFTKLIGPVVTGRAFAVTEKGYIGLVPSGAMPGDLLCLFFGASVPFVLRPRADCRDGASSGTYSLVGEAYIHGIMDGEALDSGSERDIFEIW